MTGLRNSAYEFIPAESLQRDPHSCHGPASRLRNCIQVLEALSADTEEEFLFVGEKLRNIYTRSLMIAETSGKVAGLMSGSRIREALEGLKSLTDTVALHLKREESESNESIAQLMHMLDVIHEMDETLARMEGISQTLRVLGLSTNIQNAMLRRPDEGLSLLGKDVKDFSLVIRQRSQGMRDSMTSLERMIENAVVTAKGMGKGRQADAAMVIDATVSSISSLTERYRLSSEAVGGIATTSAEISKDIFTIVTSLQFHDITRQQFEAATGAFQAICGTFDNGNTAEFPYEEADASGTLGGILHFCLHQAEPLQHARLEFVRAVEKVRESLKGVAAHVRDILGVTAKISGSRRDDGGSFLSGIEDTLASVRGRVSTLHKSVMMSKELTDAIERVIDTNSDVAGFVRQIEEIGDDIQLMALNAAIKADGIGDEGRALDVIAGTIQQVSAETQSHTAETTRMLRATAEQAGAFSRSFDADKRAFDARAREISGELHHMATALHEVNRETMEVIAGIDRTGQELLHDIEKVYQSITIHTTVDSIVAEVAENLENIAAGLRRGRPDPARMGKPAVMRPSAADQAADARVSPSVPGTCKGSAKHEGMDTMSENVELF